MSTAWSLTPATPAAAVRPVALASGDPGEQDNSSLDVEGLSTEPSSAAPEPLSPQALITRQKTLLHALEVSDMEALQWCLGAGRLRGVDLHVPRSVSRMGVFDFLLASPTDAQAEAILRFLIQSGFDCTWHSGRQHKSANPFQRGVELCSSARYAHHQTSRLLAAQQVRACRLNGVSLMDVQLWSERARETRWPVPRGASEAYQEGLSAAIERWALEASLEGGGTPKTGSLESLALNASTPGSRPNATVCGESEAECGVPSPMSERIRRKAQRL